MFVVIAASHTNKGKENVTATVSPIARPLRQYSRGVDVVVFVITIFDHSPYIAQPYGAGAI